MDHPIIYRTFTDPEEANRFAEKLLLRDVPARVAVNSAAFDLTFAGNMPRDEYQVIIDGHHRKQARAMELEKAADRVAAIDPEHYLFTFRNEELMNVLEEGEAWSALDHLLAQRILKERGIEATPEEIMQRKAARREAMDAPEKAGKSLIAAGYVFGLAGAAFGLAIGLSLRFSRKTLTNGHRAPRYCASDQIHAQRIIALSLVSAVLHGLAFLKFAA